MVGDGSQPPPVRYGTTSADQMLAGLVRGKEKFQTECGADNDPIVAQTGTRLSRHRYCWKVRGRPDVPDTHEIGKGLAPWRRAATPRRVYLQPTGRLFAHVGGGPRLGTIMADFGATPLTIISRFPWTGVSLSASLWRVHAVAGPRNAPPDPRQCANRPAPRHRLCPGLVCTPSDQSGRACLGRLAERCVASHRVASHRSAF